jgi:hypothetical protein
MHVVRLADDFGVYVKLLSSPAVGISSGRPRVVETGR